MLSNLFGKKRFALVADDERHIRDLIQIHLKMIGFGSEVFPNGEALVAAAMANGEPAIAVLDVIMPRLNGIEVALLLRKKFPSIPIVLVTAKPVSEDEKADLETRIPGVVILGKPFRATQLQKVMVGFGLYP
jgi:DNA-binding response OmpR family regulator